LDGGDQPILSDDGDTVIVFNGEVYNHQELRHELERLGHPFRSRCDTEVVLRAFLEWDLECFSRLRGMFAFAIWSESRKRLVLGRDRLGIKPLYVAHRGGDIFFGSELKAIFVHPEIPRQLSLNGLDCYLSMNYVPCPWTLVEGIEKLPPGHWLEWENGTTRSGCYWQLPFGTREQSLESATEQLDFLLRESIGNTLSRTCPWECG
jgi:asparagine synthase (glutamine-hydrolysing)